MAWRLRLASGKRDEVVEGEGGEMSTPLLSLWWYELA